MNPQGILAQKPLPPYLIELGHSVSRYVKDFFGIDIPYAEGLMLVLSTTVVILSIAVWIWVELGNQADKNSRREEMQQQQQQTPAGHSSTGATEGSKAPPAFGRLAGGLPSGEPQNGDPTTAAAPSTAGRGM
ncbi:hypothetical protein CHLRE_02g081750v5 [Chlamydomonas reinhardtii]|uniref:Uncharacterized protein n=1 Tax=Chlamydomonas reinhardtii TaxID=3055 RepID=A0A2K3E0M7_CHLRE|nr:uncharacterized protein CHLRE_02g081750v5 [Chlamydomonas reinhardtii]PNW86319.1 hypothetical protein CHLRE_02g081750v5 [Chlamydomonas reinhardtii]